MTEEEAKQKFRKIVVASIDERLALIYESFHEIWADAEAFVTEEEFMPWEQESGFAEASMAIRQKYQVPLSDWLPSTPLVSSRTELFCQSCELMVQAMRHGMTRFH